MTGPVVAVVQFAPIADAAANRDSIVALTRRALDRGATLVVFPEYSSYFIDPFDGSLAAAAEELDGAFTAQLHELAVEHGIHIVAGLLERADGERVHNTVVAVGPEGIVAVYRKQHLYDAFGQRESDWVAPGALEPAQVFEADGMRCGVMTCYDLRFPESARVLVDAGADVLIVPAEWVRGPLKEDQWSTLLRARAIENTAFVAAADHPAPLGVGRSAIIDPQGVVLAGLGATTDIAVAPLDAEAIERVRRLNPALQLRRYRVVPD
ncbi:carbon-nitrogen hydrolase family protein [Microbacterium sp. SORGH_AS_0888]|uniref:carbon-nitrogen hydrolase family protein n=1 Tax=Microbacterium sp. SORGH_AS_0888 TaxID=3041791 RepID=UPI00277DA4A1|nr:carbon-nitrogen hydrolase family protein [Microbacterium sp. SORGH_AS_0888]MDQ1128223.1 putative amidohydrolase [Microbacterium sp. SORGH_AS_0888]